MDWFLNWIATSIWAWLGITGVVVAIAVAVAIVIPEFRKIAVAIGLGALAFFALLAKGKREGLAQKQKEWDEAEKRAERRGADARREAEQEVARTPKGKVTDKFDREDL